MYLLDHTEKYWVERVRRVNGSMTYSEDLVVHQVPMWKEKLLETDILSTCPKFSETDTPGKFTTAIQYLHSYPYNNPIAHVANIAHNLPFSTDKIIFLSAYRDFVHVLNNYSHLKAIYVPMAIDVKKIQQHKQKIVHTDRIIYFGNVIQNKVNLFNIIRRMCADEGFEFDYISNNRLNATTDLTTEDAWKLISTYKYGIGVGRCAQEMMALGVKVLLLGHKFGGLITNDEEYQRQLATNMNGRIVTYDRDIRTCLRNIDKAIIQSNDIAEMNHSQLI